MDKTKLRTIFNIVLALIVVGYTVLLLISDIGITGSIIYAILFFVIIFLRDTIAPKQKRSDENDTN